MSHYCSSNYKEDSMNGSEPIRICITEYIFYPKMNNENGSRSYVQKTWYINLLLFIYLFSDKIIRNICITSLFFLGLLILLCHGHSWHIGFWEFNISVSSDVLVCGNIWQLRDKEQKPVQLQKFRVIPSSSSLGLSGSYLILQSSSSVLNYR